MTRGIVACKKRWYKINKAVAQFAGYYDQASRNIRSGSNANDIKELVYKLYSTNYGAMKEQELQTQRYSKEMEINAKEREMERMAKERERKMDMQILNADTSTMSENDELFMRLHVRK
ncbi:hypothetical protein Ahy_B10g101742 [Arachis hypogaea]|uniref:No apical meristem-associated C-terminal domain-containing protein n=1 Tax=Arachis hypogaea TaxID=3818 RepID=A0A444X0J6_ARAHY|nr:hypothetical protein Ahy_B10g101742 [Arachis hypogaea]